MAKGFVRNTISWLFAVMFIGAAAFFAAVKMVPLETIKEKISVEIKNATGRDFSFGAAQVVFWPDIGLQLEDATLGNASWAGKDPMMSLRALDVRVALMPLLQKKVEIKKFSLLNPVIRLQKGQGGKVNWQFDKTSAVQKTTTKADDGNGAVKGFNLSGIEIRNGTLIYTDGTKNGSQRVDNINLAVQYTDPASPLHLSGGVEYQKQKIALDIAVTSLLDLIGNKGSSKGALSFKTDMMTASFEGILSSKDVFLSGMTRADISSLSKTRAWLTGDQSSLPFEKMAFTGNTDISATTVRIKNGKIKLDEIEGTGDIVLKLGTRPDIKAELVVNTINLDRLTAANTDKGNVQTKKTAGWSTEAIDFRALRSFDADLTLQTEGIILQGIKAGPGKATIVLKNSKLSLKATESGVLGGDVNANIGLDASSPSAVMSAVIKVSNIAAKPLLSAFAGFDKLGGTLNAIVDVTALGASEKDIVGSLQGGGTVMFKNGAFEGIDFVRIAKLLQSRLTDMGVGGGKTDFVELGGTFTILQGIATNKDFELKGPLVQATGAGNINFPKRTLSYRVVPLLTLSSGEKDASGIGIPVDIQGPFDGIKIKPDYKSVIEQAVKDPQKIKDTVKSIKGNIKDIRKDPSQLIDNIFSGSGLPGLLAPPPKP